MHRHLALSLSTLLTIFIVLSSYASNNGNLLLSLKPEDDKVQIPSEITVSLRNSLQPGMGKVESQKLKVENLTARIDNISPATYNITVQGAQVADFSGKITVNKNTQTELAVKLQRVFTIEGRVQDRNSKPIKKAQVLARKDVKISDIDRLTFFSGSNHTMTDAKGKFKLEGLVKGTYKLKISHSDMITQTENFVINTDKNEPKTFVMRSGLQIAGKVLESDGTPAPGVKVVISKPTHSPGAKGINKTTETLDDGSFVQSGLTMGKYNVTIQDAIIHNIDAGKTDLLIKLSKKCVVHGTVMDSNGKPVKDADISFRKIVMGKREANSQAEQKMGATDADGKFKLHLQYGQKYKIKANSKKLLPATQTLMLPNTPADEIKPITIVLSRGETVRGTVISAKDNKPMQGLSVQVSPTVGLGIMLKEEIRKEPDPTGPDGKFIISGLRPGVAKLIITPADKPGWILATKQVLVKKGTAPDINITIRETGSVKGSVVMEMLEDIKPHVSLHNPANPQQHFSAEVDGKGNFVLENIPPGDYIATAISTPAGPGPGARPGPSKQRVQPLTAKVTVNSGQSAKVELKKKLEEKKNTFSINGSVLKMGEPFGEGSIDFSPTKVNESQPMSTMMFTSGKRGTLNTESKFVIEDMEEGEYVYVVRAAIKGKPAKTFALQKSYSGIITVAKNQKDLVVNISGSQLEGVIRNKQGFPAGSVNIIVSPEDMDGIKKQRLTRRSQTDTEGKYSMDCIPAGLYSISVRSRDGASSASKRNLKISRKLHNLDLDLLSNSKIYGKITIDNIEKISGVSTVAVSCEDDSIPGYGSVSDNGAYTITPPLPAGEYYVFGFKDGYAVSEKKIKLESDTEVNGSLVPGGSITVVLSSSGKEIKNRIVHLKSSDGKEVMRCRKPSQWTRSGGPWSRLLIKPTGDDGSTVIGGLKPGKYTISIDGSDKTAPATVSPLEETRIKITI